MAEDSATASKAEALTKSIEELKKLFDMLAGGDGTAGDDKAPAKEPPEKKEAASHGIAAANEIIRAQVRRADESFRATIKWMVGAVAGVALVVFGSGPFLIDRNPFAERDVWVVGGILLVATGVGLVVYASSRVTEPEDASLGELVHSFKQLESTKPMFPGKRDALTNLKAVLASESGAHLGPDLNDVSGLITKLGELQKQSLVAGQQLAGASTRHDAAEARADTLQTRLRELDKQIKDLLTVEPRDSEPEEPADTGEHIGVLLGAMMSRRGALNAHLVEAEESLQTEAAALTSAQEAVATIAAQFDVYNFHRTLVISEAWVAEKRGVFRGARRLLALGAVLAFIGGTLYLSGVSADEENKGSDGGGGATDESARTLWMPATVTVQSSAAVADLLPDDCLGRPLAARFASLEVPTPGNPFTVQVVEVGCEGGLSVGKSDAKRAGTTAPVELMILQP